MRGEHLYKIDNNGYPQLDNPIIVYFDYEDNLITEVDKDVIQAIIPQELLRPKWNGVEWVEDMTPEEIEELKKPKPVEPSENEILRDYILDVDYRLIMMELGL